MEYELDDDWGFDSTPEEIEEAREWEEMMYRNGWGDMLP